MFRSRVQLGLFTLTGVDLSLSKRQGVFSPTGVDLPWWNYSSEKKMKNIVLRGGTFRETPKNAIHRVYVKKFRRGMFPNRTRQHWNVNYLGGSRLRPQRLPWPYDISTMIFNQPRARSDRIGYVVSNKQMKTAVVACQHLVYYPKYNQKVARTWRHFAHDEDMACVEGDLVHIKECRRISKYKRYFVFSILEPNVEGRERLKLGLPAVPPPLLGYPTSRRVIKLNVTTADGTKKKTAAALQEQLQEFYRFAGRTTDGAATRLENAGDTFDDAATMIAPNAPQTELSGADVEAIEAGGESFDTGVRDTRTVKGEVAWMNREPRNKFDFSHFGKSA